MNRYQWFKVKWSVTMPQLAKKLTELFSFNENEVNGFIIDRVRENFIEARYIEKVEYQDVVKDPFGKETYYNRVSYKEFDIRISDDIPIGLEFINAPRGLQGLTSKLLQASNFELKISPLKIDVLEWINSLNIILEKQAVIKSVQIGGLELKPGVSAKTLIKGQKNVLEASHLITDGKIFTIEKIQASYNELGTILITNSGCAKIDKDIYQGYIEAIRKSLAEIIS